MITNTRQVSDTTAANQNGTVLLQIMVYAGDVGCNFLAIG
jgi:hypothetical protein